MSLKSNTEYLCGSITYIHDVSFQLSTRGRGTQMRINYMVTWLSLWVSKKMRQCPRKSWICH